MNDPSGVREADGSATDAGPSAQCHPLLNCNPDEVLERLGLTRHLHYPIGSGPGLHTEGLLMFDWPHGDGVATARFCFTTADPAYIIGYDDLVNAIRGDVDSVTVPEHVVNLASQRPRITARYNVAVRLPRPNASEEDRAAATARLAEWRAEREARARRAAEETARRQEAQAAAWATLKRFLSVEQRAEMEARNYFSVIGSAGTKYRIRTDDGPSGNVAWYDDKGDRRGQFCAHCATYDRESGTHYSIPTPDHYLTQFLELAADEKHWLSAAVLQSGEHPPSSPKRKKKKG